MYPDRNLAMLVQVCFGHGELLFSLIATNKIEDLKGHVKISKLQETQTKLVLNF